MRCENKKNTKKEEEEEKQRNNHVIFLDQWVLVPRTLIALRARAHDEQ